MKTAFVNNLDIIEAKGVIPYWKIASLLQIHENSLRIWMRREMDPERKAKVLQAITEIKQEKMLLTK
jgi:hypothetical protein